MPVIPTFTAQERAVGTRINPNAITSPLTSLGEAIDVAAEPLRQWNEKYQQAKKVTDAGNRISAATLELGGLEEKWSKHPNSAEAKAGFQKDATAILTKSLEGINDPTIRAEVQTRLQDQTVTRTLSTQRNSFSLGLQAAGAALTTSLLDMQQQAATASSPELRAQIIDNSNKQIDGTVASGFIGPEEGVRLKTEFQSGVATYSAREDIDRNPYAAKDKLQDWDKHYHGLTPLQAQALEAEADREIKNRESEARQKANEAKQLDISTKTSLFQQEYQIAATTGKTKGLVTLDSLTPTFGAEDAAKMMDTINDAANTNIATKTLALADPEQANKIIEDAKPKGLDPQYVATPEAPAGMAEQGNIDLTARPVVPNADGSFSTVESISINEDGKEVLIPRVSPDGKILSPEDATKLYRQTGQHLGKFDSVENANAYAKALHDQQAELYAGGKAPGTDFTQEQKNYETLLATQKTLNEQKQKDPALFVYTNSDAVRLGYAKADADSTQIPAAIDLSLQTQRSIGIDPSQTRALSELDAERLVTKISGSKGGDVVKMISGLETAYGKHWPKVYGELVQAGLPPGYSVIATTESPWAKQTLAEVIPVSNDEKKSLGTTRTNEVDDEVNAAIQPWAGTMSYSPDGARVIGDYRSAVQTLAYHYTLQGQTAQSAAQRAAVELIDMRYAPYLIDDPSHAGAGFNARIPIKDVDDKPIDATRVEVNASFVVSNLTPDQMWDPGGGIGLTREVRQADYLTHVRNGTWVTNRDESGLYLLDDNGRPAKLANGRYVEMKFAGMLEVEGGGILSGRKAAPKGYRVEERISRPGEIQYVPIEP